MEITIEKRLFDQYNWRLGLKIFNPG